MVEINNMRHLKKFNESISKEVTIEELEEFCDEYLAYLKDNGFEIDIFEPMGIFKKYTDKLNYITIKIKKGFYEFYWSEIEDDFIPFFQMLITKYNLVNFYENFCVEITNTRNQDKYLTKDNIINDNLSSTQLHYVSIKINKKQ